MNDQLQAKGRHVVILAHPDPNSFNAAIAQAYCQAVQACGQDVTVRNLYAMGFDPLLKNTERPDRKDMVLAPDVVLELDALSGADVVVLVYPIWFGLPPAMLVGYIDRVVGAGVTPLQVQRRTAQGPLTAGRLLTITTSGAPDSWLQKQGQIASLRDLASIYLFHAFSMRSADHLHIGGIEENLPETIVETHLAEIREKARTVCDRIAVERFGAAPSLSGFDGS